MKISVCAVFFFHFARLPIFKAVLSHDRVCLHITTWFLQPIRLHRNHKYGHLIIKSMKLPKTLLRVLKKNSTVRPEWGRRTGKETEPETGSWNWVMAAVWCLATKHPPLWDASFTQRYYWLNQWWACKVMFYSVCLCSCEDELCAQWSSDRRVKHFQMFVWLLLRCPCLSHSTLWERYLYLYLLGRDVTETSPVAPTGFQIFSKTELKWKTKVFVMLYTAMSVFWPLHWFLFLYFQVTEVQNLEHNVTMSQKL